MVTRRALLAAAGGATLLAACQSVPSPTPKGKEFLLRGVSGVTQIARLTGAGAINDTTHVLLAGTDLGHMTTVGDQTYFIFGDSFGIRAEDAFGGTGEVWKSNCVAITTDDDPTDGITFDRWILDDLEQVKEIIPGEHKPNDAVGEVTKIPTQAWSVGETLYAGYMSVHHWGDPGVWTTDHAGVARSTDGAQNWEILENLRWAGESNFVQLAHAYVEDDGTDYIYLWGIQAGRFGPVKLMRVKADDSAVTDLGAYEYFAGADGDAARWSANEDDAVVILDGGIGEFSVLWSTYLERWLLTTMLDNGSAVVFEGLSPWGPWSEPHTITTQEETPGLYAPFTSPRYVGEGGRRIYFTLSIWGPYQVFWYSMDLDKMGA